MKYFITPFILFFFSHSILSGQSILKPGLPKAAYGSKPPGLKTDSILFIAYMKGDSTLLSTYWEKKIIKNITEIDDFFCEVTKVKSSKTITYIYNDYYILLSIDSTVPYKKVDQLMERLKIIPYEKIFLSVKDYKNRNRGYYINLSVNPDKRQKIVAELYGTSYNEIKYLGSDCVVYAGIDSMPPPPPPMPLSTQDPDPLDTYLNLKKSGADTNYYFIGIDDGKPEINNKPGGAYDLSRLIMKKDSKLFLIPNEKNNYNDLIKLLDLLHQAQQAVYKLESIILYNKEFADLSYTDSSEITSRYQLYYKILSISEQLYLGKNIK